MRTPAKRSILARAGLVLWGLLTLALLFSVILLAMQLAELGSNPLSFAVPEPVSVAGAEPAEDAPKAQSITLYFADPESGLLRAERREIQSASSTAENCRKALAALIAGSTNGLPPIVPLTTQVRNVFLLPDGELVVDLTADAIDPARSSAAHESRLIHALANTLTQNALQKDEETVRTVRLLVDGAAHEGHTDLSAAYAPDPAWVGAAEGTS